MPTLIALASTFSVGSASTLVASYSVANGQRTQAAWLGLLAAGALGAWLGMMISRWLPVLPSNEPQGETSASALTEAEIGRAQVVSARHLRALIRAREKATDIRAGIQDHTLNLAQVLQELDMLVSTGSLSLDAITADVLASHADLALEDGTPARAVEHVAPARGGIFRGEESFVEGLPPFWSASLRRNRWGTISAKGFYNGPDVYRPELRVYGWCWTRAQARQLVGDWIEETIDAEAAALVGASGPVPMQGTALEGDR